MSKAAVKGNIVKYGYYRVLAAFYYIAELLDPPGETDYRDIPVIINNFNRLDMLKQLIGSLEKRGYRNIHIIDNLSTYPPLLDFYSECKYPVYRLEKNIGMNALWLSGLYKNFRRNYFVYTDSDVVPVDECPDDFLRFFRDVLKRRPLASKVGFSLKIDDIPDCYAMKEEVIRWESRFWEQKLEGEPLFRAPIDTTFALYRPRARRRHANNMIEMYRTDYPFVARHLPWYIDSRNPDAENRYYMEQAKYTIYWTKKGKEMLGGDKN
ncbi:MAG: glycosyltransferase family 2 protein [Bacteroidales bacterium]|nr:glycosyltransferase family 2 protein [Bacteroidales bacterium]